MNRLQKKTWDDLIVSVIAYGIVVFIFLNSGSIIIPDSNIHIPSGLRILIVGVVVTACVLGLWGWLVREKALLELYDERELHIQRNAKRIGDTVFNAMFIVSVGLTFLFYDIKESFPISIPIAAVLTFRVIADMVKNAVILSQLRNGAE